MTQMRFLMVALLATIAWTGVASGAYYFDIWPTTADGSMNTYPEEGYAIRGDGSLGRLTKSYHHFGFFGFGPQVYDPDLGYSDGPDGVPQGRQKCGTNDKADGVLLADWLVGKKAFAAAVYLHDLNSTCDPGAALGAYQNSPVTILGFRVANQGPFVDRGVGPLDANGNPTYPSGGGSCCASYTDATTVGGENAPGAWRMGKPYVDRAGVLGYAAQGDINESDPQHEYYVTSYVDTLHAGETVKVGSGGFGTLGLGGNSTNVPGMSGSSRWAYDYLVEKSDAMMVNSQTLTEADCTGFGGEEEPRDFACDLTYGNGWYGKHIDRCIIQAIANDPECKGLTFTSVASAFMLNPAIDTRDQGGGQYGPYIAVTATINGDVDNDGTCDVSDLLALVYAFGTVTGDAAFDPEVDFNCDASDDVVDLLTLVYNFGNTLN